METYQRFFALLEKIFRRLEKSSTKDKTYRSLIRQNEIEQCVKALTSFLDGGKEKDKAIFVKKLERLVENELDLFGDKKQLKRDAHEIANIRMSTEDRSAVLALLNKSETPIIALSSFRREKPYMSPKEQPHPATGEASETSENFDILVVCALYDPELQFFLSMVEDEEEFTDQLPRIEIKRTYYKGTLAPKGSSSTRPLRIVALSQDDTGMVDCAALTLEGILAFRPRLVAMTGVCAGRRDMGVQKGDLIIPREVWTYDTGKYTESEFKPEPKRCRVNDLVRQRIRRKGPEIVEEIAFELDSPGEGYVPKIHTELMACGSAVIDREGMLEEIAHQHRKIVGLDMESYALLRAIELADKQITGMIVKGVMDFAADKTDEMKERAAFWSASFLAKFLSSEFHALVEE